MKVCCFSGTKPHSVIWKNRNIEAGVMRLKKLIKDRLIELIEHENVRHFIAGLLIPDDMFPAEIVLELKEDYPITLEYVIPYADLTETWEKADQDRYVSLFLKSDRLKILSDYNTPECRDMFSEYLITEGDIFIAIYKVTSGEAVDTVFSAYKRGKSMHIINPTA